MRVTLTEMGGWANVRRSCTIDTSSLPRPVAARLEDGCLSVLAVSGRKDGTAVRDARTLTLVVDTNGESRRVSFSEPGAPPEMRPVLEILRPLCKPVPQTR